MTTADPYAAGVETARARARDDLRGPRSVLAAVARHELQLNSRTRFGPLHSDADVRLDGLDRVIDIVPTERGFRVDRDDRDPGFVKAGRYLLRLSHQGYPAVIVLDRLSPRLHDDVELRWWPVDARLRIRAHLEEDGTRTRIGSTASGERQAERVGWISAPIGDSTVRLLVTRLLEPGSDGLDVYFRDGTTGHGSYEVGRYVTVEREGEDVVVDFNLAYNPACALSPYYNCPIPPRENTTAVAIRAGEMTPLTGFGAAHR